MSTRTLRISDTLSLPRDAVTETFALLAIRGAGKTNAARVMAEEMFAVGAPFVAIDPVGSWWGLRAGRDGKPGGIPVPVFGGKHGDIPLERTGGQLLADLVVDQRLSCVLDLSAFESEAAKKAFLLDFARRLYQRNTEPLHLFLEEADDYVPQKPQRDELQLLRAWENIVRRGRSRGLGMTMITQRSAVIAKNVLTQVGTLIALRATSPQDRAAIESWVRYHGEKDEILATLATLEPGEAWVWSPQFLGKTVRVRFRLSTTFDSGSTPKLGGSDKAPATLADVDLADLQTRMSATIERAKAEDPKALRAEIARLRKELAAKPAAPATVEKRIEVPVLKEAQLQRVERIAERARLAVAELTAATGSLLQTANRIVHAFTPATARPPNPAANGHARRPMAAPLPTPATSRRAGGDGLAKGEARVLQAIAQHAEGVSPEHLTVLTGYKRSSRDTYLQKLRSQGLVDRRGDAIVATEAGVAQLGGDFEQLPTGDALLQHWLERLPAGEKRILEVVVAGYPKDVSAEAIEQATGYRRSSRDTYVQKLRARRLVERVGAGAVRASDLLFDGGRR